MRISREDTALVVIDIQERLLPVMSRKEDLINKCNILLAGMQVMDIPIIVTEQYPKGLGGTVAEIKENLEGTKIAEKLSFSCCGEEAFNTLLKEADCHFVIICGIESHVCVLQTVLDLLEQGYKPVVVHDCISSRKEEEKEIAMARMRGCGAIITTAESLLFELCGRAGTDEFKAISRLVK